MRGPIKLFQVPIKVNMVTVVTAGIIKGKFILQNIPKKEQPSILAASSNSLGSVIKNCLKRKILKAFPKKEGNQRGSIVFNHPKFLNIKN